MPLEVQKVPTDDIIRKLAEVINANADKQIVDYELTDTGFNLLTDDGSAIEVELSAKFLTREEYLKDTDSKVPLATESQSGRIKIVTEQDATDPENDSDAMTPLKSLLLLLDRGIPRMELEAVKGKILVIDVEAGEIVVRTVDREVDLTLQGALANGAVAQIMPVLEGGLMASLPPEPPNVDYPVVSIGPDGTLYKVNSDTTTTPTAPPDSWGNFRHYTELSGSTAPTYATVDRADFTPYDTEPVSRGIFRIVDAAHSNPIIAKEGGPSVQLSVEEQFSDDKWYATGYTVTAWTLGGVIAGVSINSSGLLTVGTASLTADVSIGVEATLSDSYTSKVSWGIQLADNHAPVCDVPVGFLPGYKDVPSSFNWPADHFLDSDNDVLAWSLQYSLDGVSWGALPSWAMFNPVNRQFAYTAPALSGGTNPITYQFRRVVIDNRGGTAYDVFPLLITNAPTP